MSIRLVVGLGNPGREYADTRHNVGFTVLEAFGHTRTAAWLKNRGFRAELARVRAPDGSDLHLMKPLTFMNETGSAVGAFCHFHRILPAHIAVIYDEINLDLGKSKLSITGSAGGHNGVASLLQHVGDGFRRFRIGIGPRLPPEIDLKDFVLGKFTEAQSDILQKLMPEYVAGLDLLLTQGVARAMNQINRRSTKDDRSSSSNEEKL